MRGDVVRLGVDGRAEVRNRAERIAERVQRHAQVVVRAGVSRAQGERAAKRARRVLVARQRRQRVAEVVPCGRIVRLHAQRLFEGIGGVFVAAERRVRVAEVVLREPETGRERERIAKAFDGVVQTPERLQRVAEIELQGGVRRAQIDGARDERSSLFVLPLLMAQHAEVVQRFDVGGFGGERGLIVAFGFGQAAVTMGREAAGKYGVHDGEFLQTPHFPTLESAAPDSSVDMLRRW